ncbi:CLUMA_CG003997, isoform A [Clunio marinus]|uniref:Metalloendopeptidase n=1 Tax=Clunio marinus TaxID=568069 RepID=A0A1J1HW74_9DIPT|nr:CLUMA_CG003997, isoform A [Clunio marinus]
MLKMMLVLIFVIYGVYLAPVNFKEMGDENLISDVDMIEDFIPQDLSESPTRVKRFNAKKHPYLRWPNKTVPYWINMTFYTSEHVQQIEKAMREIENVTCVKFVRRTYHHDYVTFTGDTGGCSSYVGRLNAEQLVKLKPSKVGTGCFKLTTIMHELMHTLGFVHTQISANRDDYVKIMWENIDKSNHKQLKVFLKRDEVVDFGLGYDFDSILHYNSKGYSTNGKPTIVAKDPSINPSRMGQRKHLSEGDIKRIKMYYSCEDEPKTISLNNQRNLTGASVPTFLPFPDQVNGTFRSVFNGPKTELGTRTEVTSVTSNQPIRLQRLLFFYPNGTERVLPLFGLKWNQWNKKL